MLPRSLNIDMEDYLKYYAIVKHLSNFQLVWSGYLGTAVLSDVISLSFGKFLLLGHQTMHRFNQCSMIFFSCGTWIQEFISGVWWYRAWLFAPDWAFPEMLKSVYQEVPFLVDKITRLQDMMPKVLIPWECTVKNCSVKTWLFLIVAIRPLQ